MLNSPSKTRATAAELQFKYKNELHQLVADIKDLDTQIERHNLAIHQLRKKRRATITRKNRVQYFVDNPPRTTRGCTQGTEVGSVKCPQCLRCAGNTVRAGFSSQTRKQLFRCVSPECLMVFTDPEISGKRRKETPKGLICHRCQGAYTFYRKKGANGGLVGWCRDCKKEFTQGGRYDLKKNLLALENRIAELGVAKHIRDILLIRAKADVFAGLGYCRTVPLDISVARREISGHYREQGSKTVYALLTGEFAQDT